MSQGPKVINKTRRKQLEKGSVQPKKKYNQVPLVPSDSQTLETNLILPTEIVLETSPS